MNKVWHASYLDDEKHWCETCGNVEKSTKIYIDEPKGFNPAYWCEDCVKNDGFEIVGWIGSKEEYLELEKKFYKTRGHL